MFLVLRLRHCDRIEISPSPRNHLLLNHAQLLLALLFLNPLVFRGAERAHILALNRNLVKNDPRDTLLTTVCCHCTQMRVVNTVRFIHIFYIVNDVCSIVNLDWLFGLFAVSEQVLQELHFDLMDSLLVQLTLVVRNFHSLMQFVFD